MSTALALAGVTHVLRDRLNDGMVNHNVAGILSTSVTVSVAAPDRVVAADAAEESQLNLYLYKVTPNTGWSQMGLPSHDSTGGHRLTNPPLALNLHYIISAYSGSDLHAEILLGYAMQLMHEFPIITREMVRTSLTPSPAIGADLPPALRALSESGLEDQFEQLRITPHYLDAEEMSKLWTATQSSMRPTAAYEVSVVLIEATSPTNAPLPVLSRGEVDPISGRDRGVVVTPSLIPPLPTLETVEPADAQPVISLGADVALNGHHLNGTSREVRLVNDKFLIDEVIAATGASAPDAITLVVPPARAADFPVGVYNVSARVTPPGETIQRETNQLGAVVAPDIINLPQTIPRDGNGDVTMTIDFTPVLRPGQRATLFFGQQEIVPQAFVPPVASLDFIAEDAPLGDHLIRLRIDGIDSPIIDRAATPPVFLPQTVTVT
ncbi:DUF4255 domain-containing protein [Ruegeria sp. 2205SS24-7]|uniref:DUF4255 domain-containing protein n=1 Tax=Ruegeria discodermiae TaxID=3064389 RepID=UPI0027408596|nr:DUF4255 domain-containing protein [Ruegeria sp. 2205SS24-7]MDP5220835.1 DUF4255 domain-containing protein [Ruegeria sp. 2205SS24-7]